MADRWALCRALGYTNVCDVRSGLVEVDIEVRSDRRLGKDTQVFQALRHRSSATHTIEPVGEALPGRTLFGEALQDTDRSSWSSLCRKPKRLGTKLDLLVTDIPAEQHLIAGRTLSVGTPLRSKETNVGGVVMPT